jgi:hypothetical protein
VRPGTEASEKAGAMMQCVSALSWEFRSSFKSFIAALTPLCHTSGHLPVASRALYLTASDESWPTNLNEMKLWHPTLFTTLRTRVLTPRSASRLLEVPRLAPRWASWDMGASAPGHRSVRKGRGDDAVHISVVRGVQIIFQIFHSCSDASVSHLWTFTRRLSRTLSYRL